MSTEKAAATPEARPITQNPEEAAEKCHQWVDSGLTKNPAIQFLVSHLIDLGCTPPDGFIQCIQCPQPAAGGFGMVEETSIASENANATVIPNKPVCERTMKDLQQQLQREKDGTSQLQIKPEIYLCQQYLENERFTHKTLVHELIHAIDKCRSKMDPLHNCIHMACTEIRAENLSGECGFWRELPRMERFAGHGAECVKRRAILSVRANPHCSARAPDYVNAAMDRCFRDIYPFERHPNQR